MRYGKFLTDNTTDVEDIIATSDGGKYTDAVLRSLKFYPIETVGDVEGENRIVRYTLIEDDSGGHIEERFTAQAQAPRTFSKLKLKGAIATAGLLPAFKELLAGMEVAPGYSAQDAFADAVNLSEANDGFKSAVAAAKDALGVTDEDVERILAASEANS